MFSSFNCTTQLPESQFSDQGLNQSHSMESSESSPPGHQGTPQEFLNKNVFIVFGSLSVVFFCLFVCLHFAACFMLLLLLLLSHFSHVRLCGTPQTAAHQAPLFVLFSQQEYRTGLLFLPPGNLLDPRTDPWVSCIGRWIPYHQRHLGSPITQHFM